MLERRLGAAAPAWLVPTARHFFDTAVREGWDAAHGGLVYGFAPQQVLDALRVRGAVLKRSPLSPDDLLVGLREAVRGFLKTYGAEA